MNQFEKLTRAANKSILTGKILSNGAARSIANSFYGQQNSYGMEFVSTGTIRGVRKLWNNLNDYSPGITMMSDGAPNSVILCAMAAYILHHGKRGPVKGWSEMWIQEEDYS